MKRSKWKTLSQNIQLWCFLFEYGEATDSYCNISNQKEMTTVCRPNAWFSCPDLLQLIKSESRVIRWMQRSLYPSNDSEGSDGSYIGSCEVLTTRGVFILSWISMSMWKRCICLAIVAGQEAENSVKWHAGETRSIPLTKNMEPIRWLSWSCWHFDRPFVLFDTFLGLHRGLHILPLQKPQLHLFVISDHFSAWRFSPALLVISFALVLTQCSQLCQ